jgi:DNA-nicking Smr family endonuclease
MARRRRRTKASPGQKEVGNEPSIFNPAFCPLVSLKKTMHFRKPEALKGEGDHPRPQASEETKAFLDAMSDVEPLPAGKDKVIRMPDPNIKPSHPPRSDELGAVEHLSGLVRGLREMDITFSDEYIEGCIHGFGRRLMEKLRKGQFAVQEHLDLHGLTKQEAEGKVREFLLQSHYRGLRCVLVIHGRGLNSEDHLPVLKERLPIWLSRGPIRKIVLAFSTARPYDGGTGAIYVLLKRKKRKAKFNLNPSP